MPDFYQTVSELKAKNLPFAVATVIAVKGSASARPGSKAIISHEGKNLLGWVGGGCAESFVARNALESMEDGLTRIIEADLDDEIFGLGMPCGGIMSVYIEPQLPKEKVSLTVPKNLEDPLSYLAASLGLELKVSLQETPALSLEQGLHVLAQAMAKTRGIPFISLKENRGVFPGGTHAASVPDQLSELLIVGSSRITEEMAKFGSLLKWKVRVYGWNLAPGNYPTGVTLEEASPGLDNFFVKKDSAVLVASHHKGDHDFIRTATESGASWVGLIASTKRAGIILNYLSEMKLDPQHISRVHAPAGLEMNCKNPTEIALSCVAQIVSLRRHDT